MRTVTRDILAMIAVPNKKTLGAGLNVGWW
jgi:hypothetical protein